MLKELSFCFFSALLLVFSFPTIDFWLFAWFAFVPLFFALEHKSKTKAFFLAYFTGIIFWSVTIYWLVHVTLLGTVILILYLSLYFGFFGLIIASVNSELRTPNLVFIPSLWVLLEYVRGHLFTGFPWALLGYSQYLNLPIIQIADITGAWGVSFLVMMVNVVIYSVSGYRLAVSGIKIKYILLPILCLATALIYGFYKLSRAPRTQHPASVRISVVQGNISQELKWDPLARDYIVEKYTRLTKEASKENPDLIIWPEAANPDVWGLDLVGLEEFSSLTKKIKIPLLLGAVVEDGEQYFNSALLIDAGGKMISRYDKLHLVPFGEYIPLRRMLPFLETIVPIGDISAGREYTIFKITNPKSQIPNKSQITNFKVTNNFGVLICFEDLFPELSRQFIKKGAHFLVNITNDAWYKKTPASYQHFQASVLRAVENRAFLVRSANTGVSGFIGPNGKIISLVRDEFGKNIFVDGYQTQEVAMAQESPPFYTVYGDVFIFLLFVFSIFYGIFHFSRKI